MTQPDIKALENALASFSNYLIGKNYPSDNHTVFEAARLYLQSLKAGNDVIKQDIPAGDYICDLHVIEENGEKQWFLDGIRTREE